MQRVTALLFCSVLMASGIVHAIDPSPPAERDRPEARRQPSRTQAVPGNWLLINSHDTAVFAEQSRIDVQGTRARIWHTMVYATPENGVKFVVGLTEFDCAARQHRSLDGAFYDEQGNTVGAVPAGDFDYVVPGSLWEAVLEAACTDFSSWDRLARRPIRVPDGVMPLEAARRLWTAARPPGPALTYTYLVGRWAEDASCRDSIEFFRNNVFNMRLPRQPSMVGTWTVGGTTLRLTGANDNRMAFQVSTIDLNSLEMTDEAGTVRRLRRC